MSYIHDALKASSEQRKAVQGGESPAAEVPVRNDDPPPRRWSLGLVPLVLLLGLLLYWFWRTPDQQVPLVPVEVETPDTAVSGPRAVATAEPDLDGVKIAIRQEPVQAPARPSAQPQISETRTEAPVAPASDASETVIQEPELAPDPYAGLPYLRQLPVEQQRELKEIRFTVHIYSNEPRSRLLKYEDRVLREGDFVRPGLRVEAIIPRGVVLQYRQTRFKVPAL